MLKLIGIQIVRYNKLCLSLTWNICVFRNFSPLVRLEKVNLTSFHTHFKPQTFFDSNKRHYIQCTFPNKIQVIKQFKLAKIYRLQTIFRDWMVLKINRVEDKSRVSHLFKIKIVSSILKDPLFLSVLLNLYFNIY